MRKPILGASLAFAIAVALHAPAGAESEGAVAEADAATLAIAELEADLLSAHTTLGAAETAAALDPADPSLQAAIDSAMAGLLEAEKALDSARQQHAENLDGA